MSKLSDHIPLLSQAGRIAALEALVDATDLAEVLCDLVCLCHEKAEHVETVWQDKAAAKVWDRHATAIRAAVKAVTARE